jgi:hypothetical protein
MSRVLCAGPGATALPVADSWPVRDFGRRGSTLRRQSSRAPLLQCSLRFSALIARLNWRSCSIDLVLCGRDAADVAIADTSSVRSSCPAPVGWTSLLERAAATLTVRADRDMLLSYRDGPKSDLFLRGTPIAALAEDAVKVEYQDGNAEISAKVEKLPEPSTLGPYTVYVLWALTPDGRAANQVVIAGSEGGKGSMRLQLEFTSPGLARLPRLEVLVNPLDPPEDQIFGRIVFATPRTEEERHDRGAHGHAVCRFCIEVHVDPLLRKCRSRNLDRKRCGGTGISGRPSGVKSIRFQ